MARVESYQHFKSSAQDHQKANNLYLGGDFTTLCATVTCTCSRREQSCSSDVSYTASYIRRMYFWKVPTVAQVKLERAKTPHNHHEGHSGPFAECPPIWRNGEFVLSVQMTLNTKLPSGPQMCLMSYLFRIPSGNHSDEFIIRLADKCVIFCLLSAVGGFLTLRLFLPFKKNARLGR